MIALFRDKQGNSKIPLAKSRLFWAGIVIKIALSCCFASEYMRELFAPFAGHFIQHLDNPYQFFIQHGNGNEFPYPPLMLWIFSLPRFVFSTLFPVTDLFTNADALLYRLPLLAADFVVLLVLMRWLKTRTRQVLIWYWLSPVLIYINYFHGQLDVIPMSMLMVSLYLLFRNRTVMSYLFLGFAIACKTNMVLVLPFYVIYLLRNSRSDMKTGALSLLTLCAAVFLINLPYIQSEGMLQMVYNNPVQQQVFDLYYQFNGRLKIYFIPSVYFILVLYYSSFRFVNRDQLILFLTFTFLALTLMIAPMQGWYYWIIPMLVYFIVRQGVREKYIFILLSALYFIYFGLMHESDYCNAFIFTNRMGSDSRSGILPYNEKWLNVSFTLLQTTLALTGYIVFKNGIRSNIQAKFLSQPYLIGIGGDSASGKSTLSNALASVFEPQNTGIIRGDDMHRWERGNENWNQFTHLNPKANKLHEDMEHARNLKSGIAIKRRYYDHNTGRFTLPKFIKPNKLIIFEGLHSFYLNNQASVYDLKIFMEPDENLRKWFKVRRDVAKRGYTAQAVLEQLNKREQDSEKYIRSQIAQADILVRYFPVEPVNPLEQETIPELGISLRVQNDLNLDKLIDTLKGINSLQIEHLYEGEFQEIKIIGTITAEQTDHCAGTLIPELEEIGVYNSEWRDKHEGLMQLLATSVIFEKLKQTNSHL